ncbi:MAG: hypothetical protein ACRCSF_01600 [Mycobacteriaceae bacterium]
MGWAELCGVPILEGLDIFGSWGEDVGDATDRLSRCEPVGRQMVLGVETALLNTA